MLQPQTDRKKLAEVRRVGNSTMVIDEAWLQRRLDGGGILTVKLEGVHYLPPQADRTEVLYFDDYKHMYKWFRTWRASNKVPTFIDGRKQPYSRQEFKEYAAARRAERRAAAKARAAGEYLELELSGCNTGGIEPFTAFELDQE